MEKVAFKLEHCYGIKKFSHEFNFSESKVQLVYAPNGVMKSSFALTLEDISLNKTTKDRIFTDRVTHREVKIDDRDITSEEIFVIQRMKTADFKEASTILANEALKEEYDSINSNLNEAKKNFLKQIQYYFGLKTNAIEDEIEKIYRMEFLAFLSKYKDEVHRITEPIYTDIVYKEIFNDKALKFLKSKDFKIKIRDYIKVLDQLVGENNFIFKKGTFNPYNADNVTKSLKENNFFSAQHKVKINNSEIDNVNELEELIKNEKDRVLKDPGQLRNNYHTCDFTFLACIPFVRNLIEFTIGDNNKDYLTLTYLLHNKPEFVEEGIKATNEITRSDVYIIFNKIFDTENVTEIPEEKVYEVINNKAREIIETPLDSSLDIKIKICLSLAIRLKSEEYMLSKISDQEFHRHIAKKLTGKIFQKFKDENPTFFQSSCSFFASSIILFLC
jgi:hypothetical protein